MPRKKKRKQKGVFDSIRKPTAPPTRHHDTDKRSKTQKPKHKKPIENDE